MGCQTKCGFSLRLPMALIDQIQRAAGGRAVPAFFVREMMTDLDLSKKQFWAIVERKSRQVDIRALIEGRDRPDKPLVLLIDEERGGFLIRLFTLW